MWNCLWGYALKRSPGINLKSMVLYRGPGFLSSATWSWMPKKHHNGLINQSMPFCSERETELRQLRKQNTEFEEQNAILSKHIENMKQAIDKLEVEAVQQRSNNMALHSHLETLRSTLTNNFMGVPLPGELPWIPTTSWACPSLVSYHGYQQLHEHARPWWVTMDTNNFMGMPLPGELPWIPTTSWACPYLVSYHGYQQLHGRAPPWWVTMDTNNFMGVPLPGKLPWIPTTSWL